MFQLSWTTTTATPSVSHESKKLIKDIWFLLSQWLSWQSCCPRPDMRCLEGNKSFSMSGSWNEEKLCETAGNEREVGVWETLWGQQCHPIIQLQVSPMPGFMEWQHYKVLYCLKPLHSCILWIHKKDLLCNILWIFQEFVSYKLLCVADIHEYKHIKSLCSWTKLDELDEL